MSGRTVRRLLAILLFFPLLASACSSEELASTEEDVFSEDDLSMFCASWQELAALVATDPEPEPETFSALFEFVDKVEPVVPAELVGDWEAFVGFNRISRDLLATVQYDFERIDDDLVARAFGDQRTADIQSKASEAAFDSMENWAATGCGDFCARWPLLSQALDELGGRIDARFAEQQDQLARFERTLSVGTELAPDTVRADWDLAVAARADWLTFWEAADYDSPLVYREEGFLGTEVGDIALEMLRDADYLAPEHLAQFTFGDEASGSDQLTTQRAWEAWRSGSELPEGWDVPNLEEQLLRIFQNPPTERHRPVDERLQTWVARNCESTGAAGRLIVSFRESVADAPGSTLLMALVREGGSVTDIVEPENLIGSACTQIGVNPWEPFWRTHNGDIEYQTWTLSTEPGEYQPSGARCWYGEQQVFPGGDYKLVAALFDGGLEAQFGGGEDLPRPRLCLEQDVQIAGDTEVMLGSPGPCDISDWPGDEAEDPWRNPPPVDPTTVGAGTLKVVVPSLMRPDEIDGSDDVQVAIVALPIGTTLNDIGREEVWPLGIMCIGLPPSMHVDERERQRMDQPTALPLGSVPVVGVPACLEPWWLAEHPPDDLLPLALFPPGEVTVLATIVYSIHEENAEGSLCAVVDVVIDGDTVAELPEWGECPR